ncbi:hypothetical protein L210DRAFT_3627500 [Boletus edulis BED1]|uniref:Uncharacterized protein n=1 Tax=Boletus edulis BED1 TaxID=1328754 RepID=A0AAD4C5W3_BOLED|nr:hypothetical protein L210DRAFT_3627500 [Boletus edulis BED1]
MSINPLIPPLGPLYGPFYFGTVMSTTSYGVACMQTYQNDPLRIKISTSAAQRTATDFGRKAFDHGTWSTSTAHLLQHIIVFAVNTGTSDGHVFSCGRHLVQQSEEMTHNVNLVLIRPVSTVMFNYERKPPTCEILESAWQTHWEMEG